MEIFIIHSLSVFPFINVLGSNNISIPLYTVKSGDIHVDGALVPDQQRWYSELSHNGTDVRITVYAGEYEKITEDGKPREFYYLDGNTIVIRENGTVKTYLAFTDNLGSILSVMDENGTQVFDASYDAWGRQTVTLNLSC